MTDAEYQEIRAHNVIHNAVVNVTDDCNLRCPYCFTESNKRVIELSTMKAAIRFLIKESSRIPDLSAKPSICFFGGEPMMQFDHIIVPTVEWTEETGLREQYGLSFSMTTNGTLLTERRLQWLSKHNIHILLSIDGDKETQDSQRPGPNNSSSFDILGPKLPTLLKYFPDVIFRSTLEPYNVTRIYENYQFAKGIGFSHYFITPNSFAEWSTEQIKTALKQLSFIAASMYQDIKNGSQPLIWDELLKFISLCFHANKTSTATSTDTLKNCGTGIKSVGIATNGDINGCQEHNTYLEHDIFYIGNIYDGVDVERHKNLLEAYLALPHPICKENPDLCNSCSFYHDCPQHFCPSHNLFSGATITENPMVVCMWKRFVKDLAYTILEQTVAEENQNMIRFLEAHLVPHQCST